jgi:hypothetical protein
MLTFFRFFTRGVAVVVAVVGTAPDQRFTVQFPDRKKPFTFSSKDLEPVKELPRGARKRGPGAGPGVEERGAPVSWWSNSAKTPQAASSTAKHVENARVGSRLATQHPQTVQSCIRLVDARVFAGHRHTLSQLPEPSCFKPLSR